MRTTRPTTRHLATAAVMALTVSLTGCPPGPPPAEPKPQGPSPASVTAPRPGGSAGAASVSSDGALLAYVHSQLGIDFTSRAEAIAWHRPTDQYRSSRDVFPNATDTTSPAVSGDGRFVFFSPSDAAESGGARLVRYSTITGAIDQFPIDPVLPGYRITEQVASNDGSVVALELRGPQGAARSTDVAFWTEARGFDVVEPYGSDVQGSLSDSVGISRNGRYLGASVTLRSGTFLLAVYDSESRSWGSRRVGAPGQWVKELATLDDGSVIFDATTFVTGAAPTSNGVRLWPWAGGSAQQLVPSDVHARGIAASANGRFVAYTESDPDAPPSFSWVGAPRLYDRATGVSVPAGRPGDMYDSDGATYPVAVSDDGLTVVLETTEIDLLVVGGPLESPTNRVVVWDRST